MNIDSDRLKDGRTDGHAHVNANIYTQVTDKRYKPPKHGVRLPEYIKSNKTTTKPSNYMIILVLPQASNYNK